jgi:hypothetical protein
VKGRENEKTRREAGDKMKQLIFYMGVWILTAGLSACGTGEAVPGEPPIITSATYQHTLYNGRPQPVDARAAKDDTAPFIVTYFPSLEALEQNRGGTTQAPTAVGDYYARIERPGGDGYAPGRPIPVEYHIQRAFVTITAEEKQEAPYDGAPKRVRASSDPPVPLETVYYSRAVTGEEALAAPPVEPGIYHVVISYPGDQNYREASKAVEFLITGR